jgi:CheY-like chemotaxis protein
LDLVLPGIDGLEVCRTLRENPMPRIQSIPIVILTGAKLEEKDLLECYKSRATDYITKPFSPTQLRSKIRS